MLTRNRGGTVNSLIAVAVAALVAAGCSTADGEDYLTVDLSDDAAVAALCGDDAATVAESFALDVSSLTGSAQTVQDAQTTLVVDWNFDGETTDEAQLQEVQDTLDERADTPCETSSPTPTGSPSPTPSASATCATWKREKADFGDLLRWMDDGVKEIRNAKTSKQAESAAMAWFDQAKTNEVTLAGTAQYILDKKVSTAGLFKDDCATNKAGKLVVEMAIALADSKYKAEKAPSNGYNSGASEKGVHVASEPGVTGDTTAIRIDLPDGRTIWVMARCGNVVTIGKPPLPTGKTDNPPRPKKKVCPPGTTGTPPNCLTIKSGNREDYTYPGPKPSVRVTSETADVSPPKVTTRKTGGGGVVDDSTGGSTPGSESGVTAPDADPPPTTSDDPPPPEGGDDETGDQTNDGSVGGPP